MTNLRNKIARALAKARCDLAMTYTEYADAVLAVIDVGEIRAEAQVEVLNAEADYLSTVHFAWKELYVGILRDRADRIAREAGIVSEGTTTGASND